MVIYECHTITATTYNKRVIVLRNGAYTAAEVNCMFVFID